MNENQQLNENNHFKIASNLNETADIHQSGNTSSITPATQIDTADIFAKLNEFSKKLAYVENGWEQTKAELASTKAELASTKAELASTKAELASTKAELVSTKAELASTKAELVSTKAELVSTKAELASANAKWERAKAELAITRADLRLEHDGNVRKQKDIDDLKAKLKKIQSAKKMRKIVLAIGNSNYGNKATKLKAAVKDAERVADGFKKYKFATTCHKNLNAKDMRRAIKKFYDQIRSSETKIGIIYFSGHGGVFERRNNGETYKEEALYSCDGKPVFLSDVMRVDEELPSKKLYYIVDACHTEVLDDEKEKSVVNNELIYNTIRAPRNRTIAFSSQYNQASEATNIESDYTGQLVELINHEPFMFEANASPAKLLRHTAEMLAKKNIKSQLISYGNNEIAKYADGSYSSDGGCIVRQYKDICSSYSNSMSSSANSSNGSSFENYEKEVVKLNELADTKVEKVRNVVDKSAELSNSSYLKR